MASSGKSPSFIDSVVNGIAEAIADIRHKVLEEGWFGRQVTDGQVPQEREQDSPYAAHGMPRSFDEYRQERDGKQQEPQREKEREREFLNQ